MDYSIVVGSCVSFVTGGLIVLTVYRKRIFGEPPTPSDKLDQEFFEVLASKVDIKLLESTLDAIELERQRIGTDMYDEMASELGSLLIDLEIVVSDGDSLPSETTKILLEMRHKVKKSVSSLRNVSGKYNRTI